jgi:hypothetical protein
VGDELSPVKGTLNLARLARVTLSRCHPWAEKRTSSCAWSPSCQSLGGTQSPGAGSRKSPQHVFVSQLTGPNPPETQVVEHQDDREPTYQQACGDEQIYLITRARLPFASHKQGLSPSPEESPISLA